MPDSDHGNLLERVRLLEQAFREWSAWTNDVHTRAQTLVPGSPPTLHPSGFGMLIHTIEERGRKTDAAIDELAKRIEARFDSFALLVAELDERRDAKLLAVNAKLVELAERRDTLFSHVNVKLDAIAAAIHGALVVLERRG